MMTQGLELAWEWCIPHMANAAAKWAFGIYADRSKSSNPEMTDLIKKIVRTVFKIREVKKMGSLFADLNCERREFITIAPDTGELKLPLTSTFLKDCMHFEVLAADRERFQEVLSQFKSNEDFESFRSTRLQTQYIRGCPPVQQPQ
jgi:hypothetical protein